LTVPEPTTSAPNISTITPQPRQTYERTGYTQDDLLNALLGEGVTNAPGGGGGLSPAQQLADTLLGINRRDLELQQTIGLRDIGQQREAGLKAAINNALQRGIFRSGIRKENEGLVNREADEAASDLQARIALALERLDAQEAAAAASRSGGGAGSGGFDVSMDDLERWLLEGNFGVSVPTITSDSPLGGAVAR
jgi:hypothetical protein